MMVNFLGSLVLQIFNNIKYLVCMTFYKNGDTHDNVYSQCYGGTKGTTFSPTLLEDGLKIIHVILECYRG